ncbi:hypothetical protein IQ07DRAFT_593170 [Pyrenochaeta sp. DS3sAY3a]|nr:hypothetical protein IQ07DRAFT_593170 [Pyrenochaeta sp. DS3sAY3a]
MRAVFKFLAVLATSYLIQEILCLDTVGRISRGEGSRQPYSPYNARALGRRQDDHVPCSKDNPCKYDDCCNGNSGYCGTGPEYCAEDVCVHNCNAKGECGKGAAEVGAFCPLNVCCNKWNKCGTTKDFCNDECQSNCNVPGSSDPNTGDVRKLVIGYWEGWSLTTRSCAKRTIDDIPVDSLTHLNLAFAYIKPGSFEIEPMPKTSENIYSQITNLKRKAPGLKIWISLGGWTYSDNGTDTQAVWGDMARDSNKRKTFANNLIKFMKHYGFDGADLDWEYPGAPDRGGKPDDPENFVLLLKDVKAAFDSDPRQYGLSFTAPTSYWYLRWFKIEQLWRYVNWINLMTYDLHGSWDSPESYIGSFVYAHTNKTEIDDALNLFWRNHVPANRINLGIGFYGRSYTLESADCSRPGCPFKSPGVAGSCTGEPGVLSYDEIEGLIRTWDLTKVHDKEAMVKYMAWGQNNQWVSYDDQETLQQKVEYARGQGLGGLFVWAIDLDDKKHTALKALLGGELGIFAKQNGYDPNANDDSDFESITGTDCTWSDCGSDRCPVGTQSVGAQQYCGMKDGSAQRKTLCCPLNKTPKTCRWSKGTGGIDGYECRGVCKDNEIPIASSTEPYIDDKHLSCYWGSAQYCCEGTQSVSDVCGWTDKCMDFNGGAEPKSKPCGANRKWVTIGQKDCRLGQGLAYCCNKEVDVSSCYWNTGSSNLLDANCAGSTTCSSTTSRIDLSKRGGPNGNGKGRSIQECLTTQSLPQPCSTCSKYNDLAWCCDTGKMAGTETINLPVPLEYLFPSPGPKENTEKLDIKIDTSIGTGSKNSKNAANDHAFGWYIMSGPENEFSSVNKRDGSHWEFFDCDNTVGESRQTIKAVCTDSSEKSNCDLIFKGGVESTVVEMPSDCGPGKYAVAWKLEPSINHDHIRHHLEKRGLSDDAVFDFTFDYDFTHFERRADSNVLLRIDYSDDPGYWQSIVADKPSGMRKRQLEVDTIFGGDHKAWLEHNWHIEKHTLHHSEIHKRWFSGDLKEWWDKQRNVDIKYDGIRHQIKDTLTVKLIDQNLNCGEYGWLDDLYFRSWVELDVDIKAAGGVTVIGKLGNLKSFDQSSAWFRCEGSVKSSIHFEAFGKVSFHTGDIELFGAHNFGASFRVPGIVTIGPDFRIIGSLSGDASMMLNATYEVGYPNFDYSMRYPIPDGEKDEPNAEETPAEPLIPTPETQFGWDMRVDGQVTARVIPKVTFGIVFDSSAVANGALDIGVNTHVQLYADARVGSTQKFEACYGANGGTKLFANVEAPTVFGQPLSRYYTLKEWNPYVVFKKRCSNDP